MFQTILVRSRCHILSSEMLREHVNLPVSVPFLFTNSSQTKNADNGTRVIYAVRIRIHCLLIGNFLMCEVFFRSDSSWRHCLHFCSLAYKLTHGRCSRIQLFRERLSEKVHATIPKGIVAGFEFTVLPHLLESYLNCLFFRGVCLRECLHLTASVREILNVFPYLSQG